MWARASPLVRSHHGPRGQPPRRPVEPARRRCFLRALASLAPLTAEGAVRWLMARHERGARAHIARRLADPGRVPSGHARPAALQAARRERFLHRPALGASAGRRHRGARTVARRHLFLHREDWQQSRRLHALSGHRGSSGARTAALQHLLRSLSLAGGRRQRRDSVAWFPAQAAVVSHRASAQSAAGIFL